MMTRREFFKTGVAGASLRNVAGCTRRAAGGGQTPVLAALIPVFLASALPPAGTARPESIAGTVAGVDQAIAGRSPAAQGVFAELSDLRRFAPSPMIVAGVWSPWPEASPEATGTFLASWRNSRFHVLGSGYGARHGPMHGARHVQPQTRTAIGYPGRPEVE